MKNKQVGPYRQRKILIMQIVIILVLISLSVTIFLVKFNKKETKYEGIVFNKEMDLDKVILVKSSDSMPIQVPVPKGYVASSVESERTVNGGFVIYEGEETVTEENLEEAKRTRNQWVWIPVQDVSEMYWIDETDKHIYGARYHFSQTGYSRYTPKSEPVVIKNKYKYDIKSEYLSIHLGGISQQEFEEEIQQRFYEMAESVATYGGFYVGRYETGDIYEKVPVVRKMNTTLSGNKLGKVMNWYQTYLRTKRIGISNQNVDTNILWEIQRDEVKKWLIDTENKDNEQMLDGISWGNFNNSEFEYEDTSGATVLKKSGTITKIPSGSTEYTKSNNIYDFVGNVMEWTMSVVFESNRNLQGGYYCTKGEDIQYETYNEALSPHSSDFYMGSRATLYIK